MKNCPFCAEEIQDAAVKCRHCGSDLLSGSPAPVSTPATTSQPEKTMYEGTVHWIVFRRPVLFIAFAIYLNTAGGPGGSSAGGLFMTIGVIDLIGRILLRKNTKFLLTTRRLSIQTGLMRKRSIELLLSKVESIAVSEPYFGQILGYGTLVVGGTGGTKESFPMVPAPQSLRKLVQDLAHV